MDAPGCELKNRQLYCECRRYFDFTVVLGTVKDKPYRARKCASLTAPARDGCGRCGRDGRMALPGSNQRMTGFQALKGCSFLTMALRVTRSLRATATMAILACLQRALSAR